MHETLPVNVLAGRPEPGHNRPPLAEILAEELATSKARADELLAAAREARIESAADAGKVADLILLLRDMERAVDRARDERKRPLLHEQRIVEATYGAVIGPLARARADTLAPMLEAWRQAHPDDAPATALASVGSRREITFCVEDLPAAIGWLLENRAGEIAQAARTILGTVLRSIGVDHATEAQIPGVSVAVGTKGQVR